MHGNNIGFVYRVFESDNFVWSPMLLMWVPMTQPGGGVGGAVTIADGADVAEGSTGDAAWAGVGAGTVVSILKKIATGGAGGGPATIADGADVTQGAIADAAVQGDNPGTVSAKLRGLNKSIAAGVPVTNAGLTNLDVALSTRLKPADTLAKVTTVDTITNPVTVTGTVTTNPPANASENLAQVGGANVSLGAKASALSIPVVLATDEATLPISAASLPLPTGASTSANQATEIASLANLDVPLSTRLKPADTLAKVSVVDTITNPVAVTNANLDVALSTRLADATFTTRINTQGQKTMATSTPVVLASDQAAIPVTVPNPLPISAAALPLPANAAIESGGHLAALDVTLDAAQGAPSSGQAGPMVQEIIEQDPTPHLFAGVLSPLSVDQDRNLRIALAKPNIEGSIERLIAELRAQRFEDYLRSGVGL